MEHQVWEPIVRRSVVVDGVDAMAPGLLSVRVELTATPPGAWRDFFLNPVGVEISLSMHPPTVMGGSIVIRPPDDELERYVAHVDERIAVANDRFEKEIVPGLRAEAEAAAAERRRVEAARSRAQQL